MRYLMVLTPALLIAASASPLWAAEYCLSPTGDDANQGTREAPWRTLAKANEALQPGDTAVFLPGEYVGAIAPANNGTSDAPIVYRSDEPRAARLIPQASDGAILLDGHEHIAIEDFFVDGADRADWGSIADSRQITVSGCEMRAIGGGSFYNFTVRDSSHVRLLDNVFDRAAPRCTDMVNILHSSHVVFEGNSTSRSGHNTLTINYSNNVVVRGNVLHNEFGRNHTVRNGGRILFEGNIMTRARDSGGSAGSVSQTSHEDSIIRFNRIFDNLGAAWSLVNYVPSISPTGMQRRPFMNINNRWYHNVFADNLGYREGYVLNVGGGAMVRNLFQNNIFYRNDWAGGHVHVDTPEMHSRDPRFINNLFHSFEPGQAKIRFDDDLWTAEEANSNTRMYGGFWSQFQGNVDADPAFVDAENRDYRLSPDSAAIDAGAPLTWAIGSGTGRALPVDDGMPFYDGFGIEGEEGDWIAVGTGDNLAQIERVELRYYQPALLHLDREVTWENEMPVSLPWTGDAPDIGAFEHGLDHHPRLIAMADPATLEPGEVVQFTIDPQGGEIATITWRFDDGAISHLPEPSHVFGEAGNYGVTVRATFTDGSRGLDAVFVRVQEPVDPAAPFVAADFEDETYITHWGYHFKFYRGHQTGYAHVERPGDEGKCMHLFYDASKANRSTADMAPGAWDVDRYPILRFDYRIPEGVPVALEFTTFSAPDRPSGFTLGGTPTRATRYDDLDAYSLTDDGRWHTVEIDVRQMREAYPELQHLRQFIFYTNWREAEGQEFWFDNLYIVAEM
ncbi:MAG: PKD domain-containing protein [Armatimonadota bacterium]|jgi:hypothetical protein